MPTALLARQHEEFQDGIDKNSVDIGILTKTRIKVTSEKRRRRGRPTGAVTKLFFVVI